MEKKDYTIMSNNDIKLHIQRLENEFETKKAQIKELCDELVEIENEYHKAENELNIRKTVY
jgi:predicted  nucleic acid-binding Zn-ribbon protein